MTKGNAGSMNTARTKTKNTAPNSRPTQQPESAGKTGNPYAETAALRRYLSALNEPSRNVDPNRLRERIAAITADAADADPVRRLHLAQERINLERRLSAIEDAADDNYEEEFIKVAASFAERKKISYRAFREYGVPAGTLRQAGIHPTR